LHVKLAEKFPQIARVGRRRGNEVIMIGQTLTKRASSSRIGARI
jgi:hypothetical protein